MFTPSVTTGLAAPAAIGHAHEAVFGPAAGIVSPAVSAASAYSQAPVAPSFAGPAGPVPSSVFGALQRARRAIRLNEEMNALAADIEQRGGHSPKSTMPKLSEAARGFNRGDIVWQTLYEPASSILPGLYEYRIAQEGAEYLANLYPRRRPFFVTPEVREALVHVADLHKEAVEALEPGKGWKLHLNFDPSNEGIISQLLDVLGRLALRGIIEIFKIGNGGGVAYGAPGKEATVYVGHGYNAKRVAEFLDRNIFHLLAPPAGDALVDDILMTPMIAARFDVSYSYCHDFLQYGWHGVPFVATDGRRNSQRKGEEARVFAHSVLTARFGEFFTDGFEGSIRP